MQISHGLYAAKCLNTWGCPELFDILIFIRKGQQRCGLWLLLLVLTSQPVNMRCELQAFRSACLSIAACLSVREDHQFSAELVATARIAAAVGLQIFVFDTFVLTHHRISL